MFNEIDLKDPMYLKDYESQIRKLPLDELYEVLDIIKKDKTLERIDIVNKRIRELDCKHKNSNGLSIFEENQLKKLSQLAEDYQQIDGLQQSNELHQGDESQTDRNIHRKGGLTAEELEEVKKYVDEIHERHKDVKIIGYTSSGRYITPVYDSKYNIEQGKTHETIQRLQKEYRENFKWSILLGSALVIVLLIVVKVIESVFNVDINLRGLH